MEVHGDRQQLVLLFDPKRTNPQALVKTIREKTRFRAEVVDGK